MINDEIRQHLFSLADKKYRDFQSSLTPSVKAEKFIGVRTPQLRIYAKELSKRSEINEFLAMLPHEYFDENQLHAFIISLDKDFESCKTQVEKFLPYVDNWATCDQMNPKIFSKNKKELLKSIYVWLRSNRTYTVRFGIKMLMDHFLDDGFDVKYPKAVAQIRSDEYYIKMMQAWYFATALAKQYESILPFIENRSLDVWTHNKAIQKATESYRISVQQKAYLRTFKIKNEKKEKTGEDNTLCRHTSGFKTCLKIFEANK